MLGARLWPDQCPGHYRLQKQLPHRKQTLVGNLMKNWDTMVTKQDSTRQQPYLDQNEQKSATTKCFICTAPNI